MSESVKEFIQKVDFRIQLLENQVAEYYNTSDFKISFDQKSLKLIEEWYFDTRPANYSPTSVIHSEDQLRVWSYLGEFMRAVVGGKWEINTLKTDNAFGLPIVINWGMKNADNPRLCPFDWEIIMFRSKNKNTFSKYIGRLKA